MLNAMNRKNSLSAELHGIRRGIARQEFQPLRLFLESASEPAELQAVREQKFLFRVPVGLLNEFLELFHVAATRCLDDPAASYASNYSRFVQQAAQIETSISATFHSLMGQLAGFSFPDLLSAVDTWLHESCADISRQVWTRAEPELTSAKRSIQDLCSVSERAFQTEIGNQNEMVFAAAHLLNQAARILDHRKGVDLGRKKREALAGALPDLVLAAHNWNCCTYAIDKVTYGEWRVKSVGTNACAFELEDLQLEYSRIIGLRRWAVQRLRAVKEARIDDLYIQKQLQQLLPIFLDNALDYFARTCGLPLGIASYWELRRRLERRLVEFGSDDDLLLLAAGEKGEEVLSDYLGGITVRWFKEVASFAEEHLPKKRQRCGETTYVLLSTLVSFLPIGEQERQNVQNAIARNSSVPPRASFYSLLDHPSILFDDGSIIFLSAFDGGLCTAAIRSNWIHDGCLGDRYGKTWE